MVEIAWLLLAETVSEIVAAAEVEMLVSAEVAMPVLSMEEIAACWRTASR